MDPVLKKKEDSRIEIRVSKDDKALFEYVSNLRGFRSFSEFARLVLQKEAREILEEERQILVSRRDKEIFFNALMGKEAKPNEALLSAIRNHRKFISGTGIEDPAI